MEKGTTTTTSTTNTTHADIDENTGFAIVINGHSLVHCLTSKLEDR